MAVVVGVGVNVAVAVAVGTGVNVAVGAGVGVTRGGGPRWNNHYRLLLVGESILLGGAR